jgi:hypothetical protein
MGILDAINPVSWIGEAIKGITTIFDDVSTTDEERAEAKAKLTMIENDLSAKAMEFEAMLAKSQADIIIAEAQGKGVLQRNWRPIIMLLFGFIILYTVVAPAFGLPEVDMSGVPDRMWSLLTVGIGGYIGGRTVEKSIKTWKEK